MSDVMLLGVLRMPPTMWDDDAIDVAQRYSRYLEAADRIESDEYTIAAMRETISRQAEFLQLIEIKNSKEDFPDRVATVVATTLLGIFVIYLLTRFF